MMKKKILFLFIIIILIGAKFSFADTNIAIKDTIFPPPNNFNAVGGCVYIYLSWNPPDPSGYNLFGYTLYRDDIGFMYYLETDIRVIIDYLVLPGIAYTYFLRAVYEEGTSEPAIASAIPYLQNIEDFEADDGGYTSNDPNGWQWGHATSGPPNAHSGVNVWGTVLSGNYINNANWTLDSPEITIPSNSPEVIFYHWYNIENSWDGGNVKISTDGGATWTVIIPEGGYPDSIFALGGEPGYTANSGGWVMAVFDLTDYVGETVRVRWHFGSDSYVHAYPGWYIDDVISGIGSMPEYGTLEGIVTNGVGNPLDSVAVSTESIFANYLVYTNPNGEYSIDPMMTGLYDITFELEHYNVMVEEDVEILPNQTTTLNMIMTAPTMSIYPTYVDTSMIPNTQLTVYLTISNDGDGPLHWFANIVYPELLKRDIQNFISASFPEEKIKLCNIPIDRPNYVEECPYQTTSNNPPAKDTWDILFAYDVDGPSGLVGLVSAETDESYLYTTKWSGSGEIAKFDLDGNFIEIFYIPGVINLRDLAYDGTYFYGSDASNYIWQMDFDTQTLVNTIPCPASQVRSIAYDEDNDAFWVNDWSSDLKLVDRSGNVLNTIYAPPSMYGSAYDNMCEGGPYLWIFTGTSTGDGCQVEQYNLNTLTLTGESHSVSEDFPGTIAGGLFTSGDIVVGTWVLGGLAQGTPDILFGYELCCWPPPPPPMEGIIEAGQSYDWPIRMNSYGQTPGTVLTADIIFTSDPDVGTITIPVTLTIIGSGIDDIPDISTKLNQNFPNPFSTSTTISFNLATKSHKKTRINIYNIKGQLVKQFIIPNSEFVINKVEWYGKDESGKPVSSGIYFYRLEVGDKIIGTKKCLLIK